MSNRPLDIVALLYSASMAISRFSQDNLLLQKACNSSVPFGDCAIGEANVQHVVSKINSWKPIIFYATPIMMIVFAGPWSDSHGRRRRPLIFLPIIGQVLTDILCILNVYFWEWPPQIAALCEALTPGLFGGYNMFWVGMLSYISDNCPTELRTLRYGIINFLFNISRLIGTGLAGFLNVRLGFYGVFIVPIIINSTAVMIGLVFVKDTSQPYDKNVVWLKPKRFIKNYFNVFKNKRSKYTITVILLLLCQSVLVGRMAGENIITYLYIRYTFKWFEVEYGIFSAYKFVIISLGTYFAGTIMSINMKLNDAVIGSIACVFDIFVAFGYVFINEPWQLLIVASVDFFHGTALSISTSLISKIVDVDELGRLNSIIRLCTALLSIFIVSLYSVTYNFTFEYVPGAVYMLDVILTFPFLTVFLIIYYKCRHLWIINGK
ncbi:Major facilitator superfamily,Major facilitator superfamily domain [Cinara cedri]|uniref:Major facilitator superfamily,Major facilitator superfamily domain n=1 Tax=Cinara cedri TaxID=506608 RepID=A0A5E4M2Q8_9HEMI|nr:Major facilitator superfamily,Major facilitator superfamily domain [Cinara cedri]